MGKLHHHFFLHCLVKRRNEYITRLYEGIFSTKSNIFDIYIFFKEGRRSLVDIGRDLDEEMEV